MGITGLLPFLEKATKPCHVSEFRDATVAIDAYCWLHKAANACAYQLASGEHTTGLINYCVKYINLLQSYGIKPILVFDGRNLPAKSDTEVKRREARNRAKQRATELIKLGKTEEARSFLKQSINITPEMASSVIKECHKLEVDCIVAPYESDAQLAFFNLKGVAEVIITEDSDLMLFGCSKVIYKLDQRGCGYLIEAEKIPISMKIRPDNYTFDKFRYMCILSGCDYVDSLQGIGLKKAEKFIKLTQETNPLIFLDKVPRYLNMRHLNITDQYKENFMLADATFRHQTVFDPYQRMLVPLTDPVAYGTDPKYCKKSGELFDNEIAYQIALGNLHPNKLTEFNNWSPSKSKLPKNSIWSGVCRKSISRKKQKLLTRKELPKSESTEKNYNEDFISEEESKLDQEVLKYFQKPKKHKPEVEIETAEEIENRISPVIVKNPFLKKISKFHLTETDTDVVVKSRYFCNQPEIVKKEIKTNSENTVDIDSSMEALQTMEITDNLSKECTDVAHINSMDVETISQSCSSQDISETIKRKKLGPCRTLGLKRKKLDGQQTLHSFFNKIGRR